MTARGSETTESKHVRRIPFNRPYATGAEFDYIREAIANAHVSGNGPFTRRCTDGSRPSSAPSACS